MRNKTFTTRKRGPKKDEEEAVEFGSLRIPKELIKEINLYKEAYAEGLKMDRKEVTSEAVLHRWMANVGRFDPDIQKVFEKKKKDRETLERNVQEATQKLADEIATRAEANGTSIVEEAMKERDAVKERAARERNLYAEKETRCIGIVKAASPTLPTEPWWVKGEWYVNEKTGQFFHVTKGKDGKSDYAFTNGAVFGRRYVSEIDMLSEEGGFIRVKVE